MTALATSLTTYDCQQRPLQYSRWEVLFAAAIGASVGVWWIGLSVINPLNTAWLLAEDPAQMLLGWEFFRREAFHWPLGAIREYGPGFGTSVVYTDSIPLLAIPLKAINAVLPESFQYFGLWVISCFVLQSVFAWMIARRAGASVFVSACCALLFPISFFMAYRARVHFSLIAHWLILWAIYLYMNVRFATGRRTWLLLAALATWVHPYLVVMSLAVWVAWMWVCVRAREQPLQILGQHAAMIGATVLFMAWAAGYFEVGKGAMDTAGYGFFSLNLVAPIASYDFSTMVPHVPILLGQGEGYLYFGVGWLLIVAAAIVLVIAGRKGVATRSAVNFVPLICATIPVTLFALSYKVTFMEHTLFEVPLPAVVHKAATTFRASGRMGWLIAYVTLVAAAVTVIRSRIGARTLAGLLAVACALQIVDAMSYASKTRAEFTERTTRQRPTLTAPFWKELGDERYKHIEFVPGGFSIGGIEQNFPYLQYAARTGRSVNLVYAARVHREGMLQNALKVQAVLKGERVRSDTLYFFRDDDHFATVRQYLTANDGYAVGDGLRVIAPGWFDGRAPGQPTVFSKP